MTERRRKKIAILATNGFEQSELFEPLKKLRESEFDVEVVSPDRGNITAWDKDNWGRNLKVDKILSEVKADDYDGLVLPGGVINPDLLRDNKNAINFVKGFFSKDKQKPVAAICHGPWTLINAEVVNGRKMTSYSSIRKDLENAGAKWVDKEVVVDNGLVSSRSPEDLPAFMDKMLEEFREGTHSRTLD